MKKKEAKEILRAAMIEQSELRAEIHKLKAKERKTIELYEHTVKNIEKNCEIKMQMLENQYKATVDELQKEIRTLKQSIDQVILS